MNRKVPLRGSETPKEIPRRCTLPKRSKCSGVKRWIRECGWIECLPSRILGSKQVEGAAGYQIRSNICKDTVVEKEKIRVGDVDGWGRTSGDDIFKRPATQNRIREGIDLRRANVICQRNGK